MIIVQGSCDIYYFLEEILKNADLKKKYNNFIIESNLYKKVELPFIKELLITPVVLYLNPNSITNNSYDADISEYSKKILDLENPELIMFLKKLDYSETSKTNLSWVAIQLNIKEDQTLNKNKIFNRFVNFETILCKNSSNARIDIEKFEEEARKNLKGIEKTFFKNFKGYFLKNLFELQLTSDKRKYIKKELKIIDNFEKELEEKEKEEKFFRVECMFCGNKETVHPNENIKNVLKPRDIFELNPDKTRFVLKCDHQDSNVKKKNYIPYNGNIKFSFIPSLGVDINDTSDKIFSYALLQYFYNFVLSDDGKIINYISSGKTFKEKSVEDIIKIIEKLNA